MHVLLLGGTSEASQLATALAQAGVNAVFSYAGRTKTPVPQPLPQRVGGFGGVSGLRDYLNANTITHVVDATHPFAAQMSRNAFEACHLAQVPLIRFERPAWAPAPGDDWHRFETLEDIAASLPDTPARVFLAIGKQHIGLFAGRPEHHYLLRLVDPPSAPLPLPNTHVEIARGPFDVADDLALLKTHAITHIVAKNSGGSGAAAKLIAARTLGLPVLMVDRPNLPGDHVTGDLAQVMAWIAHEADRGV